MCSIQDKIFQDYNPQDINWQWTWYTSTNKFDRWINDWRAVSECNVLSFSRVKSGSIYITQRDTTPRSFRLSNAHSLLMSWSSRDGGFEKQNEVCNEESSAYECNLFAVEFSKSFIFRRNKVGANTDPWGTPAIMWCQEE